MGVPGLASYVRQEVPGIEPTELGDGEDSLLLVDGHAFAFFLLKQEGMNLTKYNYTALGVAAATFVSEMVKHGLDLQFVVDGKATAHKAEELEARYMDRLEKYKQMEMVLTQDDLQVVSEKLPPPMLFLDMVFKIVEHIAQKNEHVTIWQAPGEADQPLAEICARRLREGKTNTYITSQDADFFLVKNIQYVPLDSIDLSQGTGRVYTSVIIEQELGIPDTVELALLAGNDYIGKARTESLRSIVTRIKEGSLKVKWLGDNLGEGEKFARQFYMNEQQTTELQEYGGLPFTMKPGFLERFQHENNDIGILFRRELQVLETCDKKLRSYLHAVLEIAEDRSRAMAVSTLKDIHSRIMRSSVKAGAWGEIEDRILYETMCMFLLREMSGALIFRVDELCPAFDIFEKVDALRGGGTPEEGKVGQVSLPVDSYRDAILQKVRNERVVVLHASTGAGKSTRIPLMLLEDNPRNLIMVSQPRRIAASSLYKFAKTKVGDAVGLRMGGGVREENDSRCRLRFVTSGYMLNLIASNPSYFDNHTHLILDEIHERDVDMDMLTFFVKRLLATNRTVKIILMSATIQAQVFMDYFNVHGLPLQVEGRQFEVEEVFLEDLGRKHPKLKLGNIYKSFNEGAPDPAFKDAQLKLCRQILHHIYGKTAAVLIFVAGISDIESLVLALEGEPNKYYPISIHSSIPLEEQELAWEDPPKKGQMKVIIATNAAESSITLPDLDVVIDLGVEKILRFNAKTRVSYLEDNWISKASADQRSGRTGRVRPGTVYRLYPKSFRLEPYGEPEIIRSPLDKVIITLKRRVDKEPVGPLMSQLIDPPDLSRVQFEIEHLHKLGILDSNIDERSSLTSLGRMVDRLPLDINLSLLIIGGCWLNVEAEIMLVATVLNMDRTPFKRASLNYHNDPAEFNHNVKVSTKARFEIAGGLFSEPILCARLLCAWMHADARTKQWIANERNVSFVQMERASRSFRDILGRFNGVSPHHQVEPKHPRDLFRNPFVLNRVLFLLLWQYRENLVQIKAPKLETTSYGFDFTSRKKVGAVMVKVQSKKPKIMIEPQRVTPLLHEGDKYFFFQPSEQTRVMSFQSTPVIEFDRIAKELLVHDQSKIVPRSTQEREKQKAVEAKEKQEAEARTLNKSGPTSTIQLEQLLAIGGKQQKQKKKKKKQSNPSNNVETLHVNANIFWAVMLVLDQQRKVYVVLPPQNDLIRHLKDAMLGSTSIFVATPDLIWCGGYFSADIAEWSAIAEYLTLVAPNWLQARFTRNELHVCSKNVQCPGVGVWNQLFGTEFMELKRRSTGHSKSAFQTLVLETDITSPSAPLSLISMQACMRRRGQQGDYIVLEPTKANDEQEFSVERPTIKPVTYRDTGFQTIFDLENIKRVVFERQAIAPYACSFNSGATTFAVVTSIQLTKGTAFVDQITILPDYSFIVTCLSDALVEDFWNQNVYGYGGEILECSLELIEVLDDLLGPYSQWPDSMPERYLGTAKRNLETTMRTLQGMNEGNDSSQGTRKENNGNRIYQTAKKNSTQVVHRQTARKENLSTSPSWNPRQTPTNNVATMDVEDFAEVLREWVISKGGAISTSRDIALFQRAYPLEYRELVKPTGLSKFCQRTNAGLVHDLNNQMLTVEEWSETAYAESMAQWIMREQRGSVPAALVSAFAQMNPSAYVKYVRGCGGLKTFASRHDNILAFNVSNNYLSCRINQKKKKNKKKSNKPQRAMSEAVFVNKMRSWIETDYRGLVHCRALGNFKRLYPTEYKKYIPNGIKNFAEKHDTVFLFHDYENYLSVVDDESE